LSKICTLVRNQLIPRLVFIPYYFAWVLSIPLVILRRLNPRFGKSQTGARLCIEAGTGGWDIIEYKELYQSAVEYLGESSVRRLVIVRENSYLEQVRIALDEFEPTHYAYSPRTGSQAWFEGLLQAVTIFFLFYSRGIVPIVFLTDLPVRLWRTQSALVSARSGIVVSLMSPRLIHPIFPHRRIIGPYIMALSMKALASTFPCNPSPNSTEHWNPIFTGTLYQPRTATLEAIREGLSQRGLTLEIMGRALGAPRVSDHDYWMRLALAPIVVTTADQMEQRATDWQSLPHFIYRYMEVLACGSLLVAPDLPGLNRYFQAGIHFVSFASTTDAIEKIAYYCEYEAERRVIAEQGKARANALVSSRSFWMGIDVALGRDSLT